MSDLNNKHLPTDIDSLTRKDLVEIYHIQVEEHQKLIKQLAEITDELETTRHLALKEITELKNRLKTAERYYQKPFKLIG